MRRLRTRFRVSSALATQPTLLLNFLSGTTLDSRVTFTRGTTATFVGSNGLIQTAAINTPRFDFDPVTLAPRGLLIEEQRTNLLVRSEAFDNASWAKGNATVSANSTTAPDGTASADTLISAASTAATFAQQAVAPTAAAHTFTVYAKASGAQFVQLLWSSANSTNFANFDLSAGTVTAGTYTSASITNAGSGWYRISITSTLAAAAGAVNIYLVNSGAASRGASFTGNGTSGVFLWGAQLEVGAFATSYIPTVASQVTRSADNAVMTGANFSQWYNQSEGTVLFEGGRFDDTPNFAAGWGISNGTASNEMYITRASATPRAYTRTSGGADGDLNGVQTWPLNTSAKVAFAFKVDDMALVFNGSAAITDTSAAVPPVAQLQVGRRAVAVPTSYWNGHIRQIVYYNTRLSNAQLQALTV